MNYEQANSVKELAAPVNKVLEGLDWKWQLKAGEWYISPQNIVEITEKSIKICPKCGAYKYLRDCSCGWKLDKLIPILPWEECFRILVKAGYSAQMDYTTGHKSFCTIKRPGLTSADFGSNPTEATYKAIIRLGKEIK